MEGTWVEAPAAKQVRGTLQIWASYGAVDSRHPRLDPLKTLEVQADTGQVSFTDHMACWKLNLGLFKT